MSRPARSRLLRGAALAAVLAAAGCYRLLPRAAQAHYDLAQVTRGDLLRVVTAAGTLNAVLKVQVGSQSSGIIDKLYVDYNSTVRKGQVIAQLDPATYQAVVRENQAVLAAARDTLELAETSARRARELRSGGLISQADYDQAASALRQAQAGVKGKEAVLERCKADLAHCTICAPVDGVVISRNVDVGQTVAASLSAPTLFQIANDLTRMQVDAKVSEADIAGIRAGQEVTFTVDAHPQRSFLGTVVQVRNEATTTSNVVTYDVVIQVPNPDLALKPGMTAIVSIVLDRRRNVLRLPNAALAFGAGQGVRVPGPGGLPVPRPVRTGLSDGTQTELLSGLEEGQPVITGLTALGVPENRKESASPFEDKRSMGPGGPPPPPPSAK